MRLTNPANMSDREVLLLAYGAIKALATERNDLTSTVAIIEAHLFPHAEVNAKEVYTDRQDETVPF